MADMTFPRGFITESRLSQAGLCRNMWRSANSLEWVNQRLAHVDRQWSGMRHLWNSRHFLESPLTQLLGFVCHVRVVTMATITRRWLWKKTAMICCIFFILLTVHPEAIVGFQPTWRTFFTFFKYLFFHLYMFQATSAHHQEGAIVSTHPLV
jgi:hypothetical protein